MLQVHDNTSILQSLISTFVMITVFIVINNTISKIKLCEWDGVSLECLGRELGITSPISQMINLQPCCALDVVSQTARCVISHTICEVHWYKFLPLYMRDNWVENRCSYLLLAKFSSSSPTSLDHSTGAVWIDSLWRWVEIHTHYSSHLALVPCVSLSPYQQWAVKQSTLAIDIMCCSKLCYYNVLNLSHHMTL